MTGTELPPPLANPDLFGHETAERAMLDAWTSGRMAHAWLICGPRGIGKASLAYRFARFVLSGAGEQGGGLFGEPEAPTGLAVAPDHPVFRRIAAGGHADLKVIERGYSDDKRSKQRSEIVVDDVRGVGQFLSLTPAEGGWRVVIIDAADEMNRSAANAILKLLEEPPRRALLLLLAHSPGRLLPTIRSRCRRLTLQPLAQTVVQDLLARQRPELSASDLAALATLSEGSIGKAIALADAGGLELYREIVALFAAMPNSNIAALHAFGDRVARSGADAAWRTATDLIPWWLARMIRIGGQGGPDADMPKDEAEAMRRLIQAASLDRWVEVWEKITNLFGRADAVNLDRKQVMLNAFLTVERAARS